MLHYNGFKIRPIQLEDNTQICNVIKGVFYELNLPKIGTTFVDKDTDSMFEAYQDKKSIYYVVEKDDKILGGCGIKKLEGSDKNICELQKLYFHQIRLIFLFHNHQEFYYLFQLHNKLTFYLDMLQTYCRCLYRHK